MEQPPLPSFFGEQEGDFSLVLNAVSAEKRNVARRDASLDSLATEKQQLERSESDRPGKRGGIASWIGKLCGWKM